MHRSSHELEDGNQGANQVMSEISSTVTEVFSEKDMNAQGGKAHCFLIWQRMQTNIYKLNICAMVAGPDTFSSVKSITKCIAILSPGKPFISLFTAFFKLHLEIYYLALLMFPFSWICSKRLKQQKFFAILLVGLPSRWVDDYFADKYKYSIHYKQCLTTHYCFS